MSNETNVPEPKFIPKCLMNSKERIIKVEDIVYAYSRFGQIYEEFFPIRILFLAVIRYRSSRKVCMERY